MNIIFAFVISYGLFGWNKPEKWKLREPGGSPKWDGEDFFSALPSDFCRLHVNGRGIFLKHKFEIWSSLAVTEFPKSHFCFIPLRPPKTRSFWQFPEFFRKASYICVTFLSNMKQNTSIQWQFNLWVTLNFPIEIPERRF